jgi:WD40 repeat protein
VGRRWVVAAGRDGVARLLNAADARLQASRCCGPSPLSAAALNPDETVAAVGTARGEIYLLALPSGAVLQRLADHADAVTSLAFANDTLLASASRDRSVRPNDWDGRKLNHLFQLRTPGPVAQIVFAPGGQRLAVRVQEERAVRLWRLDRLWPHLDALVPANPLPSLIASSSAPEE